MPTTDGRGLLVTPSIACRRSALDFRSAAKRWTSVWLMAHSPFWRSPGDSHPCPCTEQGKQNAVLLGRGAARDLFELLVAEVVAGRRDLGLDEDPELLERE